MYRLVVIDDEYIVVQGIKALISRLKLDYEVVGAAYDGIQGLEVIRSEKPDVVITDIRIPGLDGLSVIEAAKEECPDTYFIVISGYSEFVYAQRALTLGVKDYIDKPVTADKLKNALTRIEDEWAKTRHEDNRKAQANREKFLELERIFESSVKCITDCDAAAFREECRRAIRCLQEPGAAGFSQGILQASLCAQRCTDRKPEAGGTKFTCLFSGDGKMSEHRSSTGLWGKRSV